MPAMPTNVFDRITDAQAVVLDRIDQARTPAVHLVERAVGVADRVVPIGTERRARLAPRVGEVIDRQYAFALEFLTRQRAMTRAVVGAAAKDPHATAGTGAGTKATTGATAGA